MSTEIVTQSEAAVLDLQAHAERINLAIDSITGHEDAMMDATLESRLFVGLEIQKAQAAFGLSPQDRTIPATLSRGVTTSPNPLGFSVWLAREIPRLKRPTAIKYATCFAALELPAPEATPALIREKIKTLRHEAGKSGESMPSLQSLYKAAKPAPSKGPLVIEGPKDSAQLRLEDAREVFHLWRAQFEKLLSGGTLDDLDKKGLLEIKEFLAGARDRINARLK